MQRKKSGTKDRWQEGKTDIVGQSVLVGFLPVEQEEEEAPDGAAAKKVAWAHIAARHGMMHLDTHTGACGYDRPRAHQDVGKSQSCMV